MNFSWHWMDHGHLDYFKKKPSGRPNTKLGDHGIPNAHNRGFYSISSHVRTCMNKMHWNSIWLRARSHMNFTLHSRVRDHTTWFWRVCWDGLWTLSFGLTQFHGHGSWLVWKVALNVVEAKGQSEQTLSFWKLDKLTVGVTKCHTCRFDPNHCNFSRPFQRACQYFGISIRKFRLG